jgi:hypothetical protein
MDGLIALYAEAVRRAHVHRLRRQNGEIRLRVFLDLSARDEGAGRAFWSMTENRGTA